MLEDPALNIETDDKTGAVTVRLMGDIQKDVLAERMKQLAGVSIGFGPGRISYKETISEPGFGYGHFEPLRHYAEVHVLLEPLKRGSGLVFSSQCPRDFLSMNWQRQILSALENSRLKGVLTGSALTDMKISLIAGKAHPKHTDSGDFRQAVLRAVRQGLMKMKETNILLEPYVSFRGTLPFDALSRILFDLEERKASVSVSQKEDGSASVTGKGPLRTLGNYQKEFLIACKGNGSFAMQPAGYEESPDAETLIEQAGYDAEADVRHSCGSVFCEHGSGTFIPWNEVEERLHIPIIRERSSEGYSMNSSRVSDDEAKRIFEAAGSGNRNTKKQKEMEFKRKKKKELDLKEKVEVNTQSKLPTILIVDGYNMIYSWTDLRPLAKTSLFSAREELIHLLTDYAGSKGYQLEIVFDGNRQKNHDTASSRKGSVSVIYTKTGQNADAWIEKRVYDLQKKARVIVATSDGLIQNSILASHATRISSRELERACTSMHSNLHNPVGTATLY